MRAQCYKQSQLLHCLQLQNMEQESLNTPFWPVCSLPTKAKNEWVAGGKELIYLGVYSLNIINLRRVSVLKLLFVINEFEHFGMVFPFYALLVLVLLSLKILVF